MGWKEVRYGGTPTRVAKRGQPAATFASPPLEDSIRPELQDYPSRNQRSSLLTRRRHKPVLRTVQRAVCAKQRRHEPRSMVRPNMRGETKTVTLG
jgi:hypothetical protein